MKFNFPKQPKIRDYSDQLSAEQSIMMKLARNLTISEQEENVLQEAIKFYKKAFKYLKSINLSEIIEDDLDNIFIFLRTVFYTEIITQNKINFLNVYRVTNVSENFLEKGKVRDTKFIKNPPKEIIKESGVYGRANSYNSTIFYCAFEPGVAVLEVKPDINQRIIIAQWHNENAKEFISYSITNNKTIDNESLKKSTEAFEKRMKDYHPLFREILGLHLEFLSSEFVKDVQVTNPKKYEYLFSAYFSDLILKNDFEPIENIDEPIRHYDCIIYPSIAIKYGSENLAIIPESLHKLRPIKLMDCIVESTMYENPDISDNKLPITAKILRTSTKFIGDKIYWDDDEK